MVKSSTLVFSALSNNSVFRLARQHTQPLSSDTHSSELVPQSYFTSGVDTASLLSSDAQTAYFSGNFFSEVLISILVPPHVRIPDFFLPQIILNLPLLILQTIQNVKIIIHHTKLKEIYQLSKVK